MQLLPAVEAMHAAMGSVAEGPLPAQVDALVQATGVVVCAAPAVLVSRVVGGEGSLFLREVLAKFGPHFLTSGFLNARDQL